MSEAPKTKEDLRKEYQNLCVRAGYIQYQIFVNQQDLNTVNAAMQAVNQESFNLEEKEAQEKDKKDEN